MIMKLFYLLLFSEDTTDEWGANENTNSNAEMVLQAVATDQFRIFPRHTAGSMVQLLQDGPLTGAVSPSTASM